MTLTEEPSGLWRLDTGGTLIGYDGEHNVCSIQIKLADVTGAWTWYLDIAYFDGTVATVPLVQVDEAISALLSRSYMREGLTVVQVRGVSAGSAVKKSSVARVRFGSSVNASEQLAPPTPSQWDIYAAQVGGYRDEAAASAAAAALAATQMPYINSGGTWSVWSTSAGGFVDSGVSAAGITPDIQIGSVTTLPAGSEATASMSGTTAAPLLNLGIPKGDKGDAGGASAADLSLGLTSATVGQTIKVKAVDTDGKPTAWEAVDDRLPNVTTNDNGKFLRVVNGAWAAAEIASAGGVSF